MAPVPALPASWQCDLADDRLTWSPAIFDLFGLDRTVRPTREASLDRYEPESHRLLSHLRSEAVASRGSFTFEATLRLPDDMPRWLRISADTLCRGGRAVLLYGNMLDIGDEMAGLAARP